MRRFKRQLNADTFTLRTEECYDDLMRLRLPIDRYTLKSETHEILPRRRTNYDCNELIILRQHCSMAFVGKKHFQRGPSLCAILPSAIDGLFLRLRDLIIKQRSVIGQQTAASGISVISLRVTNLVEFVLQAAICRHINTPVVAASSSRGGDLATFIESHLELLWAGRDELSGMVPRFHRRGRLISKIRLEGCWRR